MARTFRVLCIGNSFSEDSTAFVAKIARSSKQFDTIRVANLYYSSGAIAEHYQHLLNDIPAYRYDTNDGTHWVAEPNRTIRSAVTDGEWDHIVLQHGSGRGNRYTDPACYAALPQLVNAIRGLVGDKPRLALNLPWVGLAQYDHPEILAFERDTDRLFHAICTVIRQAVDAVPDIAQILPTGKAVQTARDVFGERLYRDGYHLSIPLGRYLAGLAFFSALTDVDPRTIRWKPQAMTDEEKRALLTLL